MSLASNAKRCCVLCGSTNHVEKNHVAGQNHIAWFTMWFCRDHHNQFHALLRAAAVNLQSTDDPRVRLLRALKAITIAAWMLLEMLEHLIVKEIASAKSPSEKKDEGSS